MKKIVFAPVVFMLLGVISCNNENKTGGDQAKADSLQKEVIDLHDIAMPKSMKIPDLQNKVQALLDSVTKLPAKAQEAAAPLKAKLTDVLGELSYAENAMEKWMNEFDLDSAKTDLQKRIDYLTDEKMKVGKVKEAVLSSMEKADSVLKANF